MRIFITGGTGFIGHHLVNQFLQQGHEVTCLVREKTKKRCQESSQLHFVTGEFTNPSSWLQYIQGHEVLVNAVGIIRETKNSSFNQVHAKSPIAMFAEAKKQGVRKIIQVSALGSDDCATTRYHLSKKEADDYLQNIGISYAILRPSIVYGPGDHSMSFFSTLAALPVVPTPGDGSFALQPIHVLDLAQCANQLLTPESPSHLVMDVGGKEVLTLREILLAQSKWLGKKYHFFLPVPLAIMKISAKVTDILGKGFINSEELSMLQSGNVVKEDCFKQTFNFQARGFCEEITRKPQDLKSIWYARLFHLRHLLRLSIAFIWLATGFLCAFWIPQETSYALLEAAGITGNLAWYALYGACFLEIILGICLVINLGVYWLCWLQLGMIIFFTTIISLFMPNHWLDPFGSITKNIPLLGAILILMALEE